MGVASGRMDKVVELVAIPMGIFLESLIVAGLIVADDHVTWAVTFTAQGQMLWLHAKPEVLGCVAKNRYKDTIFVHTDG